MSRKVKIEYFVTGFLFSLLFITLLQKPDSSESGFLASYFSPDQGHPVRSSQGGLIDKKVRKVLSIATGGPAGPNAARPVILARTKK